MSSYDTWDTVSSKNTFTIIYNKFKLIFVVKFLYLVFLTCQYVKILAFNHMDVMLKWFTTFLTM